VSVRLLFKLALFAAAALLLAQVVRAADLERVAELVRGAGPWVALVVLPFAAVIAADTLAWKIVLGSLRRGIRFGRLLHIRFASEAMLLSLPMGAAFAESLKAYLLEKRCQVPTPEGVSSIAATKTLLLFALAAFLAVSVALGGTYLADASARIIGIGGLPWFILAGAAGLAVAASLTAALLLHGSMAARVHRLLLAIPVRAVRERLLRREERFLRADESFAPIARSRGRLVRAGLLIFVGFLGEALESYLILRLIGADIGFVQVLAFDATVTLIRSAAIFVPAGIGFQDAGYLAFFRAFGLPDADNLGAAFVILKRAKEVVFILLGYALLAAMRRAPLPGATGRPRVLFICGSRNQTTQMHAIARQLEGEIEAWFTPYYFDGLLLRAMRRLGLTEMTIGGRKMTERCLAYLREHGLAVDQGGRRGGYDLVLTCQDAVVPKNILGCPIILVQEGMTDPEGVLFRLYRALPWLVPRWMPSTCCTGMSDLYDRFCVASPGYRDLFVQEKGVRADKVVVTGIPNFDDCRRYLRNDFPHRGYVLVCTTDMRETLRREDRKSFLADCVAVAAGRPLVFKLHPNEHLDRATREIRAVAPDALVFQDGSAEEMIANCDELVCQYSSLAYVGLALGKPTRSYFDPAQLERLLPLQHGRAAQNIAEVCREMLRAGPRSPGGQEAHAGQVDRGEDDRGHRDVQRGGQERGDAERERTEGDRADPASRRHADADQDARLHHLQELHADQRRRRGQG
jgi:uncharacterized protein (TIRG00374 family)